jgi:hypothetical protein
VAEFNSKAIPAQPRAFLQREFLLLIQSPYLLLLYFVVFVWFCFLFVLICFRVSVCVCVCVCVCVFIFVCLLAHYLVNSQTGCSFAKQRKDKISKCPKVRSTWRHPQNSASAGELTVASLVTSLPICDRIGMFGAVHHIDSRQVKTISTQKAQPRLFKAMSFYPTMCMLCVILKVICSIRIHMDFKKPLCR